MNLLQNSSYSAYFSLDSTVSKPRSNSGVANHSGLCSDRSTTTILGWHFWLYYSSSQLMRTFAGIRGNLTETPAFLAFSSLLSVPVLLIIVYLAIFQNYGKVLQRSHFLTVSELLLRRALGFNNLRLDKRRTVWLFQFCSSSRLSWDSVVF